MTEQKDKQLIAIQLLFSGAFQTISLALIFVISFIYSLGIIGKIELRNISFGLALLFLAFGIYFFIEFFKLWKTYENG